MTTPAPFGRPLRVAHIACNLPVGGVENMMLSTFPLYDRSRVELSVCCTLKRALVGEELADMGFTVDVVRVPTRLSPLGLRSLAGWMRGRSVDVVHTHMYASNITGTVAARLAGVPVVVSHLHSTHEWRTRGRRLQERACDRWRSGYIAVSAAVEGVFRAAVPGVAAGKVRVIRNPGRFDPQNLPLAGDAGAAARAAVRREFAIPAGAPLVGAVARLSGVKGLDTLIEALALLGAAEPAPHVLLVGDGEERGPLERLAFARGVHGRVHFAGERTDVAPFYRAFDFCALPSRFEGAGNVVLEAMAFGLPMVASRAGGLPEYVHEGETGLLVEPDNPAELAGAMARLMAAPDLARAMGKAARIRVAAHSPSAYADTVTAYYEELSRARRDRFRMA